MATPTIPGGGMLTGLKVTFTTMIKTLFLPKKHLKTVNYPVVKEEPHPRARGVIALDHLAAYRHEVPVQRLRFELMFDMMWSPTSPIVRPLE